MITNDQEDARGEGAVQREKKERKTK